MLDIFYKEDIHIFILSSTKTKKKKIQSACAIRHFKRFVISFFPRLILQGLTLILFVLSSGCDYAWLCSFAGLLDVCDIVYFSQEEKK